MRSPNHLNVSLDFGEQLLKEEGKGILRWMVEGAIQHLRECDEVGGYRLTQAQVDRVEQLLAESDSIRKFVTERIQFSRGSDLSTAEIIEAYFDYCSERGWVAFPTKTVERNLPDIMLENFRSAVGTNVMRDGKRVRGYPNVALVGTSADDRPDFELH